MREIDVDSFAGGGGASAGIEAAIGKPVDVAINHDPEAIAMHRANHPHTIHYINDIWDVNPADIVRAHGPVRLAWFSPDCTHHSKAKGGRPIRDRKSRDLAWVVVAWARVAKPRIIMLENVEEFATWGPLAEDRRPCAERKGQTFALWIAALRKAGYKVEWRELRACDYGTPTIRKRLFVVARRDGRPITWPEPTHGPGRLPYRTAAECIDWSIPVHSIFLTKEEGRKVGCKRPLAEATLRRIARGIFKYAIDAKRPFILPITHNGDDRVHSVDEPLRTVTTAHRGELAVVAPFVTPYRGTKPGGQPRVRGADDPLHTVTTEPSAGIVAAYLAQHNTGMLGRDARDPLSTIVGKGSTQAVVTAHLTAKVAPYFVSRYGERNGQDPRSRDAQEPMSTVVPTGNGASLVAALLTNQMTSNTDGGQGDLFKPINTILTGGHKMLVEAFLVKYYGTGRTSPVSAPAPTLTTKARIGLVTVEGQDYHIVDIGMRMLTPRELFAAQGFPPDYEIAPIYNGKPLTKTMQIKMCGNSVCPDVAEALVRVNVESAQGELYA